MIQRQLARARTLGFSIAILSCVGLPLRATAQQWFAQVYTKNRDYIEVSVDTRTIAANSRLEDVSMVVDLYDAKHKAIGTKTLAFTDADVPFLKPNVVHRRYFRKSSNAAQSVSGEYMSFTTVVSGGKGDAPGAEQRQEGRVKSSGTIQAKAAQIHVTGFSPAMKGKQVMPLHPK